MHSICNWSLYRLLRFSSTLESLVGCYVFFACFVRLGGIIFEEVPSRGAVCFLKSYWGCSTHPNAQPLFVIGLCLALPCLRSSSTLQLLVGCYDFLACFVLPCDIIFKEVLSRGAVCFETLLKLSYQTSQLLFVIIGLCIAHFNSNGIKLCLMNGSDKT